MDLSVVDGFGVSLEQTVIMEMGTDISKFPDEKHFCSWLGLALKHTSTARKCRCEISAGKVLNNNTLKTKNHAGQAFRMAAQSVKQAKCVWYLLPTFESQVGILSGHGAYHCADGPAHVEIPSGV